MNYEESRLRTFKNWPSNAPVDARRIAKAGFYYMGQNLEVQCFSCGGRISEWNYSDKVMNLHKALDPRCPFVLSPALSGNVPVGSVSTRDRPNILTDQSERPSSSQIDEDIEVPNTSQDFAENSSPAGGSEMQQESARLKTFSTWPIPFIVAPNRLAEAGFYYVHQGDKVRCAYCSVIIGRWESGDSPMLEHRRHSPHCTFLQVQSSRPASTTDTSGIVFRQQCADRSEGTMKCLGVRTHKVAKHRKYSSKDSRLATYTSWPRYVLQTPDDLAEAGFYYAGSDDQVRCFHCDGGLRKWESSDDPWVEHARWFHECDYVLSVKGEQFVEDCIQQYPPIVPELDPNSIMKVCKSRPVSETVRVRLVPEEELEALMSSTVAVAALQIGLDFSRVKTAIRQKIEQTGVPFSSSHDLIEASLDVQLDEIPFQDSEEVWSTPLHSPVRSKKVNTRVLRNLHRPVPLEETDSSDSENAKASCQSCTSVQEEVKADESVASQNHSSFNNTDKKVTLEEEIRRLREARLCKICMDSEVCIVFLPCGHLVTCLNCAHSLAACPVCRQDIKATVRTFLS